LAKRRARDAPLGFRRSLVSVLELDGGRGWNQRFVIQRLVLGGSGGREGSHVPGPTPAMTAHAFCEDMIIFVSFGWSLAVSLVSLLRAVDEPASMQIQLCRGRKWWTRE
jgi:hypothetical protein